MSLEELFTGSLHPAKIQASLAKHRLSDDDVLLMHLNNKLFLFPHLSKDDKNAAADIALRHFGEHRNMDYAIKIGVRAAVGFPAMNMSMPGLDNHRMPTRREEAEELGIEAAAEELCDLPDAELFQTLKQCLKAETWDRFVCDMIDEAKESYYRSKCDE